MPGGWRSVLDSCFLFPLFCERVSHGKFQEAGQEAGEVCEKGPGQKGDREGGSGSVGHGSGLGRSG